MGIKKKERGLKLILMSDLFIKIPLLKLREREMSQNTEIKKTVEVYKIQLKNPIS